MKAIVHTSTRRVKAVVRENGEVILPHTVPSLLDRGYPCMMLGLNGELSLTTGDLDYWIKNGGKPVSTGDDITLEF